MPSFKKSVRNRQCIMVVWVFNPDNLPDANSSVEYMNENHVFRALVDTGATKTCVSKRVVDKLGLDAKGKQMMNSASDLAEVNEYRIHLTIPTKDSEYPTEIKTEHWINRSVMELLNPSGGYDILLGMDILERCNLFIARGDFFLSY